MGWNETGITTWDEEHLALRSMHDIFVPIIKAVKERNEIELFDTYWDSVDPYLLPYMTSSALSEVFIKIDDIVVGEWGLEQGTPNPTWVNYTDNGGSWHKQTEIPYWTKTGILSELGQSEYIRYQGTTVQYQPSFPGAPVVDVEVSQLQPLPSVEWVIQIYKMLNLFRWNRKPARAFSGFLRDQKKKFSQGVDYLTAAAAWPANYSDDINNDGTRVVASNNITTGLVELLRQYTEDDDLQAVSPYRSPSLANYKYDVTIYVVPENNGTFDSHGDNIEKDKLALVERFTGKQDYKLPWGYRNSPNFTDGVPNDPGANAATGWVIIDTGDAVFEWDVTDGFEYVTELN